MLQVEEYAETPSLPIAGSEGGGAAAPLCRAASLKVLALALLREVEVLAENASPAVAGRINLAEEVCRFEAELIRSALAKTGGRQRRAARLLGTSASTLNAKIKRYNISVSETE